MSTLWKYFKTTPTLPKSRSTLLEYTPKKKNTLLDYNSGLFQLVCCDFYFLNSPYSAAGFYFHKAFENHGDANAVGCDTQESNGSTKKGIHGTIPLARSSMGSTTIIVVFLVILLFLIFFKFFQILI